MSEPVLVTEENDCVTITLDRPENFNAFGVELVEGIHSAFDSLACSPPRLLIFQANGKGFSGGLDLSGLEAETDGDLLLRMVRIEQLLQRVRHASFATAAHVHGACYGAAADLVLSCRARIASPNARFLMPGMRFGIVLGTRRLRDVVGEQYAYQLLDRTHPFGTEEALATGFIDKVIERCDWDKEVQDLMSKLSRFTKEAYAIRVASLTSDSRALDMQALVTSIAMGSIKARMLEYVEEIKRV